MRRYLYLTLTPEALISSMLSPEDFGNYLAVGTKKRTRGQAVFFEVEEELIKDQLPTDYIEKRCIPHDDGRSKNSLYLSIYRVLEQMPLEALKNLYLTTNDGRVLELEKGDYVPEPNDNLHLYQELCPVTPRVASKLPPKDFLNYMTTTTTNNQVVLPKLVFVELELGELAETPKNGSVKNLPYQNIEHLRDCLIGLKYHDKEKQVKTIIRFFQGDLLYRTCKNGFFVGNKNNILYYPFPSLNELSEKHYAWWRSAISIGF